MQSECTYSSFLSCAVLQSLRNWWKSGCFKHILHSGIFIIVSRLWIIATCSSWERDGTQRLFLRIDLWCPVVEAQDTNLGGRLFMRSGLLPCGLKLPNMRRCSSPRLVTALLAKLEQEPEPGHLVLVSQLPPKATIFSHQLLVQNHFHSIKKTHECFCCKLQISIWLSQPHIHSWRMSYILQSLIK